MRYLVDTSVWSLALRRDTRMAVPEVTVLQTALVSGDDVMATGMVLLELLRGAIPASGQAAIRTAFDALGFIEPTRTDYEEAAELANTCRRSGVQLGSVDSLLAQLAIRHELTLLTTDRDFTHAARHIPLHIWKTDQHQG